MFFGRGYDQDGYNYWIGNLNNDSETRYELLFGVAESAKNKTIFTEVTGFWGTALHTRHNVRIKKF